MLRCWVIRGCFILPILLCLIGWPCSLSHRLFLEYYFPTRSFGLGTVNGSVCFNNSGVLASHDGFYWDIWSRPTAWFYPSEKYWFGFEYFSDPNRTLLYIPYWFLILMLSIALFFTWRKTGKKNGAGFLVLARNGGK